jgi:NAD(P)-dependent dehydrogenase (short-subunit alcohol dehydrogenase family)
VIEDAVADAGVEAFALECDAADESSVRECVQEATTRMGGLDVVVYAAGTAPLGRIEELDAAVWTRMLVTNVVGAATVAREALRELRRSERGTVVLLSSHTVGSPWPSLAAYAASKAALEELGRGLRIEEPGLRVVIVRVGNTATSFADAWDPGRFEEAFGIWIESQMMRHRVMSAGEMAERLLAVIAEEGEEVDDGSSELTVRGEEETF